MTASFAKTVSELMKTSGLIFRFILEAAGKGEERTWIDVDSSQDYESLKEKLSGLGYTIGNLQNIPGYTGYTFLVSWENV